ncbi:MAG: PAS domain-containing protein [Parvibaculum sp.]|uniref:PAS domain-containing protein n=1 Tax=Parvibaculum sp. TaxID=2024848 RepID=UPI002721097F|nr:PAS domain-containing protein [Parvibaculum sp.]MDO8837968.1 PAS domain-containing protein [Parvibaculum sp.]
MFDNLTEFRPVADLSRLHGNLAALHRYWQDKRRHGTLPARRDIDPVEIPRLLPHIALLDILRDPLDWRYRLVGTRIVEVMGAERTGKRMRELFTPPAIEATVTLMTELLATREPLAFSGRLFWLDKDHVAFETLILPLASDGERVDMAVMGLEFGQPKA